MYGTVRSATRTPSAPSAVRGDEDLAAGVVRHVARRGAARVGLPRPAADPEGQVGAGTAADANRLAAVERRRSAAAPARPGRATGCDSSPPSSSPSTKPMKIWRPPCPVIDLEQRQARRRLVAAWAPARGRRTRPPSAAPSARRGGGERAAARPPTARAGLAPPSTSPTAAASCDPSAASGSSTTTSTRSPGRRPAAAIRFLHQPGWPTRSTRPS